MIYLGTSGYSYDDWRGVYYPAELGPHERLEYYAAEFDAVELNFSYYRMPTAEHLERLVARTPERFRFAIKAHQSMTHSRDEPSAFATFRRTVEPMWRQGRLCTVLLQFPYAFRNTERNVAYLTHCFAELSGLPLTVEFRHNEWLHQEILGLLREHGVAFCNVDMPRLPGLLPRTALVTAPWAYVRLHGRNAHKWWKHEHAWERYDYSYSEQELAEWVPHLREMANRAEEVYVFANNHWEGQSVSAIRQMRLLLDRGTGPAPEVSPHLR